MVRGIDGLIIIGPKCLIPLKARAYTDLSDRKEAGEKIDTKDIKKHKNDIFRLYTILDPSVKPGIAETIRADLLQAFERLRYDVVDLKALGVPGTTVSEILKELEAFYEL